jgi:hypothetical protein
VNCLREPSLGWRIPVETPNRFGPCPLTTPTCGLLHHPRRSVESYFSIGS